MEENAALKQQINGQNAAIGYLNDRLTHNKQRYGPLMDAYDDFIARSHEVRQHAILVTTTVWIADKPDPETSGIVVIGNNDGQTADDIERAGRQLNHLGCWLRHLFLVQRRRSTPLPLPTNMEQSIVSLADYHKATLSCRQPIFLLLFGIVTGRPVPPSIVEFAKEWSTHQKKGPVSAMVAWNILQSGFQEHTRNEPPLLASLLKGFFDAYGHRVPIRLRQVLTLLTIVPSDTSTMNAAQSILDASTIRITRPLLKLTSTFDCLDNMHMIKSDGGVADYTIEGLEYATPKDMYDQGLYTKEILQDHRPVQPGDMTINGKRNVKDYLPSAAAWRFLWKMDNESFASILSTGADILRVFGSTRSIVEEIENCSSQQSFETLACLIEQNGVTLKGAPFALVESEKDKWWVELGPRPQNRLCPNDKDPLLWYNRVDLLDVVLKSLGSHEGCAAIARARQFEVGVGGHEKHFQVGGTNNDAMNVEQAVNLEEKDAGHSGTKEITDEDVDTEEDEVEEPIIPMQVADVALEEQDDDDDDDDDDDNEGGNEEGKWARNNADNLCNEYNLQVVCLMSDGSPWSLWTKQSRLDAEGGTTHFDDGHLYWSAGPYHKRKATLGTQRRWGYFIDPLVRTCYDSIRKLEYFWTGTDQRHHELIESILVAGLRYGISLAYQLANEDKDCLKRVTVDDIQQYMMEMVQKFPALTNIILYLRTSLIAGGQRSTPKKGDEGDFMGYRHLCNLALPMYCVSNKRVYADLGIQEQLERSTRRKFHNGVVQRKMTTSRTPRDNPDAMDIRQEGQIGGGRVESEAARNGKVETVHSKKVMRANINNRHERSSRRRNMNKQLGMEDIVDLAEEDEQYEGEGMIEQRYLDEDKKKDSFLTEQMHQIFLRGAQFALKMFGPDDDKRRDASGTLIPEGKWVSCVDVRDQLHPEGVVAYQIGENRVESLVRKRVFQGRNFDIPATHDMEASTMSGRRNIAARKKAGYPHEPNVHNNRYNLPSTMKGGVIKTIPSLCKDSVALNRLRERRLRVQTWRDMFGEVVAGTRMWTPETVAVEMIELKKQFNTTTVNKSWFTRHFNITFGSGKTSNKKIMELALKKNGMIHKKWGEALIACQKKFGASDSLKQSIVLTDKVVMRNVWEVSFDQGNTFQNILQHSLLENKLNDVNDRHYDLTDATAAAMAPDDESSEEDSYDHLLGLLEEAEEDETQELQEDSQGNVM